MSTIHDWWCGDPVAVEVGIAALRRLRAFRPGSDDIRDAVRRQQKRWGHVPSGTLTRAEWARLVGEPSLSASNDASPPGQDDGSDMTAPQET